MKISMEKIFITLLAISTLTTSIAYAGSITCPPTKPIKEYARAIPPTEFVIDGPGIPGVWAFEVKHNKLTFENREWGLATWISGDVAEKYEEAQKIALKNVITLNDSAVGILEDGGGAFLCVYKGQYGSVMLGTN